MSNVESAPKRREGGCFVTFLIALAERNLFDLMICMETQLTWYGQSAFKIVTPSGNVLLIDPWLTNPVYKRGKEEIAALKRVELILITHGHSDHVGDAVEIAKRTRAKLVATYDLGDAMVKSLGYPAELAETDTIGHFGGELTLLNGDVKVLFVRAHHGSGITVDDESGARYGGSPRGVFITGCPGPIIFYNPGTHFFFPNAFVFPFYKKEVFLFLFLGPFFMRPPPGGPA